MYLKLIQARMQLNIILRNFVCSLTLHPLQLWQKKRIFHSSPWPPRWLTVHMPTIFCRFPHKSFRLVSSRRLLPYSSFSGNEENLINFASYLFMLQTASVLVLPRCLCLFPALSTLFWDIKQSSFTYSHSGIVSVLLIMLDQYFSSSSCDLCGSSPLCGLAV